MMDPKTDKMLANAVTQLGRQARHQVVLRKSFVRGLIVSLLLTVFVGVPLVVLSITGAVEAKVCTDNPRC